MITNVQLDPKLLKEAKEQTGITTTRQVIHEALQTLVKLKRQPSLIKLIGKVQLDPKYDYKKSRS